MIRELSLPRNAPCLPGIARPSLLAVGFLTERFGMYLQMVGKKGINVLQRHLSLLIGLAFILLASLLAAYSTLQHRRFVKALAPKPDPGRVQRDRRCDPQQSCGSPRRGPIPLRAAWVSLAGHAARFRSGSVC
jgi:hypothetical protein